MRAYLILLCVATLYWFLPIVAEDTDTSEEQLIDDGLFSGELPIDGDTDEYNHDEPTSTTTPSDQQPGHDKNHFEPHHWYPLVPPEHRPFPHHFPPYFPPPMPLQFPPMGPHFSPEMPPVPRFLPELPPQPFPLPHFQPDYPAMPPPGFLPQVSPPELNFPPELSPQFPPGYPAMPPHFPAEFPPIPSHFPPNSHSLNYHSHYYQQSIDHAHKQGHAPHHHSYQSHLGDDPHFAVLLPSGLLLCYSIQGENNRVFNLISNNDVHINALFVPDSMRNEVTWIGSLGIVYHPKQNGGGNVTFLSFTSDNMSITITTRIKTGGNLFIQSSSYKATRIASITITGNHVNLNHTHLFQNRPIVNVALPNIKLNFSVKFDHAHLDMSWNSVGGQAPVSHGLIGQFYRPGVELDTVRGILVMPNKEPVPVKRKPVWSFVEGVARGVAKDEYCWTAMNTGVQGRGLIDGHYLEYAVPDLLSTDFHSIKVSH